MKKASEASQKQDPMDVALKVLNDEANAILNLRTSVDSTFEQAVKLIQNASGKLVVTGVGKSGHIGRKMASTFSSTGTPSFFIHPSEASHGDLGMIDSQDIVLAISFSGNTAELSDLIRYCSRRDVALIAMTSSRESQLGKAANYCIEAKVVSEADPLRLAPTSSTTAYLALGDALAMAVATQNEFKPENFAEFHPGGSLGRKLLTRIKDVMHTSANVPLVNPSEPLLSVAQSMTSREVRGVAGVVEEEQLVGIITDGDIRRALNRDSFSTDLTAKDIMTHSPITIDENIFAADALALMEKRKIQVVFVTSEDRPIGAIHIHDLVTLGLG